MTNVLHGNKVSLHLQVATRLEQRVRRGQYREGEVLPSFRALGQEFGVSLNVIQRAVSHLSEKGILVPHHGKGLAVAHAERCRRTAITFGFVQPFSAREAFEQQVFLYAEEAFTNRDNLMIIRSSQGDAAQERQIATHLVSNGVQGILLWPVDNNPNGAFFQELSRQVPIVLVDRLLEGANLPAAVLDFYGAGRSICRHLLETLNRKRLLAVVDTLKVSPNRDLTHAFREQARELGREDGLTLVEWPVTDLIRQVNVRDFSGVAAYRDLVRQQLRDGGCDALFCMHEEFLDFVLVENDLLAEFPGLRLASMTDPVLNTRTRRYNESGVVRWAMDFPRMIAAAADRLQEWVLTRACPKDVVRIEIPLQYSDSL
jgi:DNA-binding LacI/PurR family transcriptional regulator